ncbi:hypothetical protein L1049_018416 [Liquidambar formosana]|uniref:KIB1-4 beta-propeller domain-containing protein n=1 Tax=Liquidambar formosana TaxID=63359 RepID=A0AAP0RA24_LIQFO
MQFVDSNGELFIVNIFSISKLEVFKIDFSHNELVRIYSLDDRVFFLSRQYSISLSAKEIEIGGNSLYFTGDDDETMCVFNFEDESLSLTAHHLSNNGTFSHDGLMPVLRFANNSRYNELEIIKNEEEEEEVSKGKKESEVEEEEEEGEEEELGVSNDKKKEEEEAEEEDEVSNAKKESEVEEEEEEEEVSNGKTESGVEDENVAIAEVIGQNFQLNFKS